MKNGRQYQPDWDPKAIGDCSEAIVLATLARTGHIVLMPFGDNARFDLVTYWDGQYCRIQVKTGRLENGAVVAYPVSTTSKHTCRRYTKDEIDAFAIYCPETQEVYFISIEDVGQRQVLYLRVDETRNNQKKGILWAKDYQL